jgi:hypothetical protein
LVRSYRFRHRPSRPYIHLFHDAMDLIRTGYQVDQLPLPQRQARPAWSLRFRLARSVSQTKMAPSFRKGAIFLRVR